MSAIRGIPNHPRPIRKDEVRRLVADSNPLILEIGCNDGTDSAEFVKAIPGVRLHCFEPDPRPILRFESRFNMSGKSVASINGSEIWLHRTAVGDRDGTTTLYMSGGESGQPRFAHLNGDWDLSSSIRKPTGHLSYSPWVTFDRTIEVPVQRLDSWISAYPTERISFIWADTQGGEGDLIRGATETLKRTRYLYCEWYERELYEGQPKLNEIREMLGPTWSILSIYEGCNFLAVNRAAQ